MTGRRALAVDALVYLLLSLLLTLSWWRGLLPFPLLGGDLGNIAGFAAGWLYPGDFAADPVLGNTATLRHYMALNVPLMMGLAALVGDLGTAGIALLAPTMLAQALGFRWLGRVVTGDRWGGFLLGLMAFGQVPLTVDFFGTYPDVQPRFLFQVLFPLLLGSLIRFGGDPRHWWWIFALHALGMYIHPVSAPTVALSSWLMLPLLKPASLDWGGFAKSAFAAGLAFLVVAAPSAANYLGHHEHGARPDFTQTIDLYRVLLGPYFTDAATYLVYTYSDWRPRLFTPAFGLLGGVAVWLLLPKGRPVVRLLVAWATAAVVGSLGVTLAQQAVVRNFQVLPVEVDTIRNLRFVQPVFMIVGLWGALGAGRRLSGRAGAAVAALAAGLWLVVCKPGVMPVRDTLACLQSGRLLCPPEEWLHRRAVLEHLRTMVPRGTPVLPAVDRYQGTDLALAVRYHALLPLVFTYKDGGSSLLYANHVALRHWLVVARALEEAHGRNDVIAIAALANSEGARVLILDFPSVAPAGWREDGRFGPYVVMIREG